MLQLSLVRHAEAAASAAGNLDRHRTLTESGREAAQAFGRFLQRENLVPDQILSSDATRAVDTAHLLLNAAGVSRPVVIIEKLYTADPEEVMMMIHGYGEASSKHLMVVGHNPTMGALASDLAGEASTELRHFAPASCARFAVSALEWESLHPSHATLRRVTGAADYLAGQ